MRGGRALDACYPRCVAELETNRIECAHCGELVNVAGETGFKDPRACPACGETLETVRAMREEDTGRFRRLPRLR
jgi:hypothetical protein